MAMSNRNLVPIDTSTGEIITAGEPLKYDNLNSEGEFDMSKRIKRKHISMSKRLALVSKYNDTCVYCGRENLSKDGVVNIDHVTPLDRGGEDCFDNYQLTCKSCNSSKRNRTHEEFIEYLRRKEEVDAILDWILENVPKSQDAVDYIDGTLPEVRKYQILKPLYDYMTKIN